MLKKYIRYIKDNPERYWFKAKLFGWGWVPARWQGWLTLFVFIGLIVFNFLRIDSHSRYLLENRRTTALAMGVSKKR